MNLVLLTLACIVSSVGCFVLGFLAYKHNPKSKVNRHFALLCLLFTVWLIILYFSYVTYDLTLVRASMALICLALLELFLFSYSFRHGLVPRRIKITLFSFSVLFFILSFTPLIILGIRVVVGNFAVASAGYAMPFFAIYAIGISFSSIYQLYKSTRTGNAIKSLQAKYILSGIAVTMIMQLVFLFIFVNVFHTSKYMPIGMMSILFFVVFTAYAMTRYKFLDAKIFLKKSLLYGIVLFSLFLIALFISISLFLILQKIIIINSIIFFTITSLFLAIIFNKIKIKAKNVVDGIFFRDQISLSRRLNESKIILNSTHELKSYIVKLAGYIQEVINAPVIEILVFQERYKRYKSFFPTKSKYNIPFSNKAMSEISKIRGIYLKEEMLHLKKAPYIRNLMKKKAAAVYFSIGHEDMPLAIILIGTHKNGRAFSPSDFDKLEEYRSSAEEILPTILYWQRTIEDIKYQ